MSINCSNYVENQLEIVLQTAPEVQVPDVLDILLNTINDSFTGLYHISPPFTMHYAVRK